MSLMRTLCDTHYLVGPGEEHAQGEGAEQRAADHAHDREGPLGSRGHHNTPHYSAIRPRRHTGQRRLAAMAVLRSFNSSFWAEEGFTRTLRNDETLRPNPNHPLTLPLDFARSR